MFFWGKKNTPLGKAILKYLQMKTHDIQDLLQNKPGEGGAQTH